MLVETDWKEIPRSVLSGLKSQVETIITMVDVVGENRALFIRDGTKIVLLYEKQRLVIR